MAEAPCQSGPIRKSIGLLTLAAFLAGAVTVAGCSLHFVECPPFSHRTDVAEFDVIVLLYFTQARNARSAQGATGHAGDSDLLDEVRKGALLRVRPKAMTAAAAAAAVSVILAGVLPILWARASAPTRCNASPRRCWAAWSPRPGCRCSWWRQPAC